MSTRYFKYPNSFGLIKNIHYQNMLNQIPMLDVLILRAHNYLPFSTIVGDPDFRYRFNPFDNNMSYIWEYEFRNNIFLLNVGGLNTAYEMVTSVSENTFKNDYEIGWLVCDFGRHIINELKNYSGIIV